MSENQRHIMLAVGAIGLTLGLFFMLLSLVTLVKTGKITLLLLLVLSSWLFYEGLSPQVQVRIKCMVKYHWREYWGTCRRQVARVGL